MSGQITPEEERRWPATDIELLRRTGSFGDSIGLIDRHTIVGLYIQAASGKTLIRAVLRDDLEALLAAYPTDAP